MTLLKPDLAYPRNITIQEGLGLALWWAGLYFSGMCVLFGAAATLPMFIFGKPLLAAEVLGKASGIGILWWIIARALLNLLTSR